MTAKKSASSSAIVAPARAAKVIGEDQSRDRGKKGAEDGEEVILPDIFRDVARRGRPGRTSQRIDDHEAHPAHRERDDDGNDDCEKRLVPRGLHAARGGQLRMDGRQD